MDERDITVGKRPGRLAPVIRVLMRPEITIGVVFVALLLEKLKLMLPAARGPIVFAILQHDGAVVTLLLLLYVAGSAAVNRDIKGRVSRAAATILGKLCMAVFLLALLLYAADVFAYKFFATRLYAGDVVTFFLEPRGVLSLIHVGYHALWKLSAKRLAAGALAILLIVRAVYALLARPVHPMIPTRYLATAAATLLVLSFIPVPLYFYSYGDKPLYRTYLSVMQISSSRAISAIHLEPRSCLRRCLRRAKQAEIAD